MKPEIGTMNSNAEISDSTLIDERKSDVHRSSFIVHRSEKWQLTRAAFDVLLEHLDAADREAAGEKYLLLRRNLVRFFAGRGFAAAEDAADEVLNRLARKLDAGETIENINQYSVGVARMLVLELRKKTARDQKFVNESPRSEAAPAPEEPDEQLDCLNCCLNELPADGRRLILAYYDGDGREKIENRQRLAAELGIPPNALRSRAIRLREKLETCLSRCLKRGKI